MAKQPKLTKLLENIFQENPRINRYEVIEGVKSFNIVGKSLYNNSNIMEIAKQLSHIAENAHSHVLGETDEWFDKVSVNKNMQTLKKRVAEFKKAAMESHQLNQRLTGLYEDIGHVLNRYYEIDEDVDDVSDEEAAKSFDDMKDKDLDNDGDTDDSDEYLHHKLGQVAKKTESAGGEESSKDDEEMKEAIRETERNLNKRPTKRLKDIGNVATGIPALGQIARKFNK
tara:strand:- start:175 stop:855 length:681 start_codon:yes stop_codon:yes gene_type:complete